MSSQSIKIVAPSNRFSDELETFINETLLLITKDESKNHLIFHAQNSYNQIRSYMATAHSDASGSPYTTFHDYVCAQTDFMTQYLKLAKAFGKEIRLHTRVLLSHQSLPPNRRGFDILVGNARRSDDKVYRNSEYARKYLPRGNFILEYRLDEASEPFYFPLLQGYRKFAGQEDEDQVCGEILARYFSKPVEEAADIVRTSKENGEAAHLAVLKCEDGEFLYSVGSKNTHVIVSGFHDLEEACFVGKSESKVYSAALEIGSAVLRKLQSLPDVHRRLLCDFLWQTRLTACFEVLCPGHQHIVALDPMAIAYPIFYGAAFPLIESCTSFDLGLNPILPLLLMQRLGFQTVEFDVMHYTPAALGSLAKTVRNAYQIEGAVNVFLDPNGSVIGLQKLKSVWYICLRVIREKAKCCLSEMRAGSDTSAAIARTKQSLKIQFDALEKCFELSRRTRSAYQTLGEKFLDYCLDPMRNSESFESKRREQLSNQFPFLWKEFLEKTQSTDLVIDEMD